MFLTPDLRESFRGRVIWVAAILLSFSLGSPGQADQSSQTQEESLEASADPEDEQDTDESEEAAEDDAEKPTKSGYDKAHKGSSPTSVEADLHADDLLKRPVFKLLRRTVEPLYRFKDRVNGTWGIAFGVDYNFLNQYASFSFTEKQATSGAFRVYGTWNMFHSKQKIDGGLVFRVENRHMIGGGVTPRDLGFDAGSALSTASFKDFAWGITSLYWKQFFADRRFAFVFGQMDPGDFMDAYPLLSAWTALTCPPKTSPV